MKNLSQKFCVYLGINMYGERWAVRGNVIWSSGGWVVAQSLYHSYDLKIKPKPTSYQIHDTLTSAVKSWFSGGFYGALVSLFAMFSFFLSSFSLISSSSLSTSSSLFTSFSIRSRTFFLPMTWLLPLAISIAIFTLLLTFLSHEHLKTSPVCAMLIYLFVGFTFEILSHLALNSHCSQG